MTTPNTRDLEADGFWQGLCYAVANFYRMHGEDSQCYEMLKESGFEIDYTKKHRVAPYDANPCREIFRTQGGSIRPISRRYR